MKVVHFTAEVKPWTFFYRAHGEFASMYDQSLFWLWSEQARRTEQVVGPGVFSTSMAMKVVALSDLVTRFVIACKNATDTLTQDPVRRLCDAAAREYENGHVRLRSNAFTLVLSTWQGQRLPLDFLVNVYAGRLVGRVSVEV